jgi:hypothetical protein
MYNSFINRYFPLELENATIWGTVNDVLVFLTSQVVTSLKVLTQLMVGYVISFGHKVANYSIIVQLSAYGLIFLGTHFRAFSLMFLFSGRGLATEFIDRLLARCTARSKVRSEIIKLVVHHSRIICIWVLHLLFTMAGRSSPLLR